MQTAKVFDDGHTIKLPDGYHFDGGNIGIEQRGACVVLYPKYIRGTEFVPNLGEFTDDFFTSIEESYKDTFLESPRETL